jgi:hypothetical protein
MSESQKQQQSKTQQDIDVFNVYQKYFEEQQKLILNYWTQVLNSMWGTGK